MTPRLRWLLGAFIALGPIAAAADDGRLKKHAEELARLRERIEAVNKSIDADRSQKDELHDSVELAERKLADAQVQQHRLGGQVDQQSAKLRQAQAEEAAAAQRLNAQKTALARQLRAAYVLGGTGGGGGRIELLLSQDDLDRVGRLLTYYDYMSRARRDSINGIKSEIEQAATLENRTQHELDLLHGLQSQRQQALVEIEADRSARRQAMNQVQSRLDDESQELKRLQDSEAQLQVLLESLKRALARAPPPTLRKPFSGKHGQMQWPLRGAILANYGDPKADGRLQWKGIWIEAPEGTAVHACAAGQVAYVGWLSSFGLIVVLEHGGGLFTLYGHNASVSKAVGDTVAAGEVIAATGNTGGYEQTGLYFEVRKGTDPMDPREWLTR